MDNKKQIKKEKLLKKQQPYDYKSSHFVKNLQHKHKQIRDNRIILFMKHLYLRRFVNLFQISIIVASTVITFFESLQNHIFLQDSQIQILSICLSTYIAIFTAIYKFIKIDDRKEEIYKLLQNFNDIENTIMNKIEKVKLLQDKFQDEMKITFKTPYILNHTYNLITNAFDKDPQISQPLGEAEQKNDDMSIIEEVSLQGTEEDLSLTEDESKDDNSISNKVVSGYSKPFHQPKSKCKETDDIMNDPDSFKIYLKLLNKYEVLFQQIIDEYEKEEIDMKILIANTNFDAILSYNEIIYYHGKIVESMLLEKVHQNNRNLLDLNVDQLKYYYDNIMKLRILINNEECVEKRKEYIDKLYEFAESSGQFYNDNNINYENNWCNNFCLFFSNICRFCLIMKLYLGLTFRTNKINTMIHDIKQAKMEYYDYDVETGKFDDDVNYPNSPRKTMKSSMMFKQKKSYFCF